MNNILPYFNKAACEQILLGSRVAVLTILVTWSLTGFAIICITVLACATPNYNSGEYVKRKNVGGDIGLTATALFSASSSTRLDVCDILSNS